MKFARHTVPAAILAAALLLPVLADRLRSSSDRCAMDGVPVRSSFVVHLRESSGRERLFCGVRCAQAWLVRTGIAPEQILVTDSASGRAIDARDASFVRTRAAAGDGTPDLIRVFADRADALRHVESYGGRLLDGAERPFGGERHGVPDGRPGGN